MDSTLETKPSPRIPIELEVEFKKNYAREASLGKIRNISLTGCFLNTGVPLKPEEKINVVLTVSGRIRKISAKVVWSSLRGAGIQFMPFNNRDLQIVDDIMYFATERTSSTKELLDNILKKVA